jgi:mannopine transport system permease protein
VSTTLVQPAAAPSIRQRRAAQRGQLPTWLALALLAPLAALMTGVFFVPIARLLLTSVTEPSLSIANYRQLATEPLYAQVLFRTMWIAAAATASALLLGYPVAMLMARPRSWVTALASVCIMVPLWTSVLIRSYAWILLLDRNGLVNQVLLAAGAIRTPLSLLYSNGAVLVAMTHVLLPFMILPIFSSLRSTPADLPRAALNLGAGATRVFLEVTLPLSLPGVFAGCLIVFVMSLGFYITPALIGGPRTLMIATLIGQQAMDLLNWPFAGAIAFVLLLLSLGITGLFKRLLRLENVVAHD